MQKKGRSISDPASFFYFFYESFSSLMKLTIRVGEISLLAELPQDIFEEMDIKVGQEVHLILKLRSLRVY